MGIWGERGQIRFGIAKNTMYVKIWDLFHKKLDSNKKITNKGVDAIGSKQVWVITGI